MIKNMLYIRHIQIQQHNTKYNDLSRLKVKRWKKIHYNNIDKKAGVALLISSKVDVKGKK